MYIVKNLYEEHINKDSLVIRLKNLANSGVLSWYAIILHDKDKKENGEEKKPHFHCLIESDSTSHHLKQDLKDKLSMFDFWIGCEKSQMQLEAVRNITKAVRYLTHKDNLEKYQYNDNEVITSDIELYQEYIVKQIKSKESDEMLEELLEIALKKQLEGKPMRPIDILYFFKSRGRLDYYMKNKIKITELIQVYCSDIASIY